MSTEPAKCCAHGPGYATPLDAMKNGPRETTMFVTCPRYNSTKGDMLAAIDVDPTSDTFCQIVSRVNFPNVGDECHHTGWNACSSCFGDTTRSRTHLVVPCLNSSRIYFIDARNPRDLKLDKTIEPERMHEQDVSFPHTSHCLADGNIMISTLGDKDGTGKGDFVLIDGKTFQITGTWAKDGSKIPFGYDFWYQPQHNIMVSTEWGHPKHIKEGFDMAHVAEGKYGISMHFWDWKNHSLIESIELDKPYGITPLEVRFLHDPSSTDGYCGTGLGGSIYHIFKDEPNSRFQVEKVIIVDELKVENWVYPTMAANITFILTSLDDKYLYFSCWMHGDVRQYDITDRRHPKLVGRVFLGGQCTTDSGVVVANEEFTAPPPRIIKGRRIRGGPQMLQLSLDGKRLYVTTSVYTKWDKQFYPDLAEKGGQMMQLDVNTETGGLEVNENFLVDFGEVEDGPFVAHEMRYPGGDCTSDIWI